MKVQSGRDVPHDINVIIEIPAYSDPVKYEVDKDTGALTVDRFMGTAMQYPTNYGYIPHSLSDDGDPVDVLVISPAPLLSGCVIRCRPIGVLKMVDEAGSDAKVLAVPVEKLTPCYKKVASYEDISEDVLIGYISFKETSFEDEVEEFIINNITLDNILDKINKFGIESLTDTDKKCLESF
jgi:inorganic pyrophosphatase